MNFIWRRKSTKHHRSFYYTRHARARSQCQAGNRFKRRQLAVHTPLTWIFEAKLLHNGRKEKKKGTSCKCFSKATSFTWYATDRTIRIIQHVIIFKMKCQRNVTETKVQHLFRLDKFSRSIQMSFRKKLGWFWPNFWIVVNGPDIDKYQCILKKKVILNNKTQKTIQG